MTRDDIIRMAREADLLVTERLPEDSPFVAELERFAALVAKAEREACAMLAYEYSKPATGGSWRESIAVAIRARGDR